MNGESQEDRLVRMGMEEMDRFNDAFRLLATGAASSNDVIPASPRTLESDMKLGSQEPQAPVDATTDPTATQVDAANRVMDENHDVLRALANTHPDAKP